MECPHSLPFVREYGCLTPYWEHVSCQDVILFPLVCSLAFVQCIPLGFVRDSGSSICLSALKHEGTLWLWGSNFAIVFIGNSDKKAVINSHCFPGISWLMVWLLFLSLLNVAWPFAVGIMRVESEEGHVRGYLDYQSGFPAGKDSGFRISEKLFPPQPLPCSGGF